MFWVILCWLQNQSQTRLHCKGFPLSFLGISLDQGLEICPLLTLGLVHFFVAKFL